MKEFAPNNPPENIDSILNANITSAIENMIPEEEYQEYVKLEKQRTKSGLTEVEFNRHNFLRGKIFKSTITTKTLSEFKRTLELLGYTQEKMIDTVDHENAHTNVGQMLDIQHLGYSLILRKTKNGYIALPQTSFDTDNVKFNKDIHIKILYAPKTYGNTLSKGDLREVDSLNNTDLNS